MKPAWIAIRDNKALTKVNYIKLNAGDCVKFGRLMARIGQGVVVTVYVNLCVWVGEGKREKEGCRQGH